MIRYGSGMTVGPSPVCRAPHVYCTESGVMCSFADSQSAMFGLKPKCSPVQWSLKAGFSEDDVFVVDEVVRLDIGSKSRGKLEEEEEGGESACSGFKRRETKIQRQRGTVKLRLGDGIFLDPRGRSPIQLDFTRFDLDKHLWSG